ncbi:hypothetical protein GCM10010466_25690 [Planomonospora alba]|uniref:Uncharacterized protein n=1 Tax=Planomonospora alba TaxID=161354 RepID=A0ABP6N1Y9_9ACTN
MKHEEELRRLDEELARLRAEVAGMRDQVGDLGATDANERAQMINMADEQENLIGELEARRAALLRSADAE